jgi:hypothetical protein
MSSSKKVLCHCPKCQGAFVSGRTEREHRNGPAVRLQKKPASRKRRRQDTGTLFYINHLMFSIIRVVYGKDDVMDDNPGPPPATTCGLSDVRFQLMFHMFHLA